MPIVKVRRPFPRMSISVDQGIRFGQLAPDLLVR